MSRHLQLGKMGEQKAVEYLQQKGYEILAQNWRSGKAEIDIIAKHENILVFAEVKTRTNFSFGFPEEAVSVKKQKLLAKAAGDFLYERKFENEIRFDILSLYCDKNENWHIRHIQDAFFPNPADDVSDYE